MSAPTVNLLLVDDIEANLEALDALLSRPGIRLLKAHSGDEALDLLLQHDVALALLDVQMPRMDGFELAELMRGSQRTRGIPIIFVTAAVYDARRTFRGYEIGAVDFLYKPLDPQLLVGKVDVFVRLYRQQQALAEQMRELEQALRVNETFTAVLGHDLRNPLGAILNGAELLLRAPQDAALVHGTAERVRASAARMGRMIEQVLEFARLRNGRIDLRLERFDLAPVCRAVAEELEPEGAARRIRVQVDGDATGHWDRGLLAQVFSNLLANALKHGTPGGPVTVTVDGDAADAVRVEVHNGGAIPAELLGHVFEAYRSGPERRDARGGGLGLGLHIAERLVHAHAGTIRVRSDERTGTRFEVRLPRFVAST